MNHAANTVYAQRAANAGYLDMPTLFLTASYDYICECVESRLPEPMRERCRNLTERTVDAGHWMAQEKPVDVNNAFDPLVGECRAAGMAAAAVVAAALMRALDKAR